jgi:hypothetical protein
MSPQLERTLEGTPIILLMAVGTLVALFWIFFPIVVAGRLKEIVKLLREIRDNTEPRGTAVRPPSSVKYKAGGGD